MTEDFITGVVSPNICLVAKGEIPKMNGECKKEYSCMTFEIGSYTYLEDECINNIINPSIGMNTYDYMFLMFDVKANLDISILKNLDTMCLIVKKLHCFNLIFVYNVDVLSILCGNMENKKMCEACGGPVNDGETYCEYCIDENGNLKSYEEILEGGIQWAMSEEGEKILGKKFSNKDETKSMIEEHMKNLPAWK